MISFKVSGSTKRTEEFLKKIGSGDIFAGLESIAREGVTALAEATPIDSGRAKESWGYEVSKTKGSYTITWTNNDIENGFPVAVMIQYGHGTGTGGYVQGIDYINPAMRPIFQKLADKAWRVVTSA
jgi:hypothetical protein